MKNKVSLAVSFFGVMSILAIAPIAKADRSDRRPHRPGPRPTYPRPPQMYSDVVQCESTGERFEQCETRLNQIRQIEVIDQRSHDDCIEGRSYGASGSRIWVDRGCRAVFRVYGF